MGEATMLPGEPCNGGGIREALRQLRDGERVGFPAGAMSKTTWSDGLQDREWQASVLQIIAKAKVPRYTLYISTTRTAGGATCLDISAGGARCAFLPKCFARRIDNAYFCRKAHNRRRAGDPWREAIRIGSGYISGR